MLEFQWPWIFLLAPLPWFLRKLSPPKETAGEPALRVPFLEDFQSSHKKITLRQRTWPLFIYYLLWLLLLIATSRPQWVGEPIELPVSGRDIMLAIDLSQSMSQRFSFTSRSLTKLDATKAVASDFIKNRIGDRIGLILFGEQAYVQAPLTFDRKTVITLLEEAVPGLAGRSTAIGDAIGLAVKRHENTSDEHVLILLTDGVSNAGQIKPLKAAEIASFNKLKIHTIGVGPRNSRDLDEKTLSLISKETGGRYFRAHDIDELQDIYRLIDQLEPVEKDRQSYRPTWALFYWPLAVAIISAGIMFVFRIWRWA